MGQHHRGVARLSFAVALLAGIACGGSEEVEERPRPRRERAARPARDAGPALYDSRGELLPGDTVLGVVVPRAMRSAPGGERRGKRARLETREPREKVLSFLRRRLTTGRVETGPNGARFIDATPRAPGDTGRKVDVWVYADARNTTRVDIYDRTTRPGPGPTDEEVLREFKRIPNNERRAGQTE